MPNEQDTDDLIAAFDDICMLIGATNGVRSRTMSVEEAHALLNQVVGEWVDRKQLIFFLGCVFGKMSQDYARLAATHGQSTEEMLNEDYRKLLD